MGVGMGVCAFYVCSYACVGIECECECMIVMVCVFVCGWWGYCV